jgi:hypothetical protein
MKYTQVKNPQWANAEHTIINCDVDFDDLQEEFVPFSATLNDIYAHTIQIFNECVAGNYGAIAEYVEPPVPEYVPPPTPTKAELLAKLQEIQAQIAAL